MARDGAPCDDRAMGADPSGEDLSEARREGELGPAARARAEGRPYHVAITRSAMTPLVNDDGSPRGNFPLPCLPVMGACEVCPARCCRLRVSVSLLDAVLYGHALGVPVLAGIIVGASDHRSHAFSLAPDPRIEPGENGFAGRAELFLRRRGDGACHGLIDVGGHERCGVYTARPSVCRLYPFSWTSDVARGGPGSVRCPVPYGVTEDEERRALREIEVSIERWEAHDDLVLEWEARDVEARTIEAFLTFALPRAAERAGVPPARVLIADTPEARLAAAIASSLSHRRR